MAQNYDDEMALLYDDVISRLNKGDSLTDMDLDTLVEVYDYAYDLSDEFVTAEIMNNVLTRDKDFLPMLERKAFRYALLSEIQGAKSVASRLPESSFVRRLIFSETNWEAENWQESYKKLIDGIAPQSLDSYATMCLIDFTMAVDNVGHLSELLPAILPLCGYPEDFLVDLSGTLLDNDLAEEVVPVMLELTTLQPFSLDYWLQLAEVYVNRLENYDEGYSAIDYALAIDPESGRALMLKGDLLMKVEGHADEVSRIADQLLRIPEFKDDALYLKAGALIKQENQSEAITYLLRYAEVCNNPLDIFVLILSLDPKALKGRKLRDKLIDLIREADITEITNWIMRAKNLLDEKVFDSLMRAIVEADVQIDDQVFSLVLVHLYKAGDYIKVREMFGQRELTTDLSPFDRLLYLMNCLRLGDNKDVREALSEIGEEIFMFVHNSDAQGKLLQVGASKLIYDLNRYLDSHKCSKPDMDALNYMDPFTI